MPRLFLLFNHRLTHEQESQAYSSFGVTTIVSPPSEVAALWRQLPAGARQISLLLDPVRNWLEVDAEPGDLVLIHGDFGACFLMASFAQNRGIIPVYSTTERQMVEEHLDDGSVDMVHRFRHVLFRKYGE